MSLLYLHVLQMYLVFFADINSLGSSASKILRLVDLTVSTITLEDKFDTICLILIYGHCNEIMIFVKKKKKYLKINIFGKINFKITERNRGKNKLIKRINNRFALYTRVKMLFKIKIIHSAINKLTFHFSS